MNFQHFTCSLDIFALFITFLFFKVHFIYLIYLFRNICSAVNLLDIIFFCNLQDNENFPKISFHLFFPHYSNTVSIALIMTKKIVVSA